MGWLCPQHWSVTHTEGIHFHNKTIPEVQKLLPKVTRRSLMASCDAKVPTQEQVNALSRDCATHTAIPEFIEEILD